MQIDPTEMHPAVYVSERGDVHTTGVYIKTADSTNIFEQMLHEISKVENEKIEDLMIFEGVTEWRVAVKGRYAHIGSIYVLAMLDPDWRP